MPSQMEIRVVIVEDNYLFREAMHTILNGTIGFICSGAYEDAMRIEEKITRSRPDVILMDIEMPGIDGIEATRKISEKFPDVKVLIQTVFNENEKIFYALCAGASGYILKSDPPNSYLESIKEVYNGGAAMSTSVAKRVLSFFSNKNVILIAPTSEDYKLTNREKELLNMMIDGDDFKSIAEKAFISYDTVRTHVRNIYQKLHVANRTEAVMKAIQQGII